MIGAAAVRRWRSPAWSAAPPGARGQHADVRRGSGRRFPPLPPATKLVLQMLVAAVFLFLLPACTSPGTRRLDLLLGFAWIVGITNAVNLLDNMDGLAAGVAVIAAAVVPRACSASMARRRPNRWPLGMAAFIGVTPGSCCSTSIPASIFMGDSGSHLHRRHFWPARRSWRRPTMASQLAPVAAIPVVAAADSDLRHGVRDAGPRAVGAQRVSRRARPHVASAGRARHRRAPRRAGAVRAGRWLGGAVGVGLIGCPPGLAFGLVGLYAAVAGSGGHVSRPRAGEPRCAAGCHAAADRGHDALPALRGRCLDTLLIAGAYYLAFIGRFRDARVRPVRAVFHAVGAARGRHSDRRRCGCRASTGSVWGRLGAREMFALGAGLGARRGRRRSSPCCTSTGSRGTRAGCSPTTPFWRRPSS